MRKQPMLAVVLGVALAAQPITQVAAAAYAGPPVARSQARLVERIQGGPHREWRRGPAPHAYPGWRGAPGMARSRALAWACGLDWLDPIGLDAPG